MIARFSEAVGAALVGNNSEALVGNNSNNSRQFHFRWNWREVGFGRQQLLAHSIEKPSFHMKKKSDSSRPDIYKALNLFDCQTESASQEWQHVFLERAGRGPQRLPPTRERPVFVSESEPA